MEASMDAMEEAVRMRGVGHTELTASTLLRQGFVVGVSNPKTIVFLVALLAPIVGVTEPDSNWPNARYVLPALIRVWAVCWSKMDRFWVKAIPSLPVGITQKSKLWRRHALIMVYRLYAVRRLM